MSRTVKPHSTCRVAPKSSPGLPPPSPPPPPPTVSLFRKAGINLDLIAAIAANFSNSPFVQADVDVLKAMGVKVCRIFVDPSFIINGIQRTDDHGLLSDNTFTAPILAHLDATIALLVSNGVACYPALAIDDSTDSLGRPGIRTLYGIAGTFNSHMIAFAQFLASRYMALGSPHYVGPTLMGIGIMNEPHFYPATLTAKWHTWSDSQLWSNPTHTGLMDLMVAAVRAIAPSHLIIIDTVQLANPSVLSYQTPSTDTNVLYAIHCYFPNNLVNQGQPGTPPDPYYVFPGHGEVIGAAPPPDANGHAFTNGATGLRWLTGTVLTARSQKVRYATDQWGHAEDGTQHNPDTGALIPRRVLDYFSLEATNQQVLDFIQLGFTWADTHGVNMILEEFGCTNQANAAQRQRWVSLIVADCDAKGRGRIYWSLGGNQFGMRPKGDLSLSTATYNGAGYDVALVSELHYSG